MRLLNGETKVITLIAVGFVLINLVGLDRSPLVWMDEVTLNDPAKELALRGQMVSSVFAGHNGFGEAYYWQPPGQPLLMALVYKLFSFGVWQTRIPGVLFGSGTLVVLYLLSFQLLRSQKGALLSAVILGLDPKYIESARSGRMDTQVLFLALIGVLFFVNILNDDQKIYGRLRVAMAGLCLGLAGITHPLAIAWVTALGVIVLLSRGRWQLRIFIWVTVLSAVPALIWIISAAIAGDLDLLRIQFLEHGSSRLSSGGVFHRIIEEVIRYSDEYRLAPGMLGLYFLGLVWVIWNRDRFRGSAGMWLATLFMVPALFNALFMSKKVGFYFLHPVAILSIAAGAVMVALWEGYFTPNAGRITLRLGKCVLILAFVNVLAVGIIGRYAALAYQWHQRDYRLVVLELAENVPPGSVIWGPPDIWYAVEEAGAALRIWGEPDPRMHDLIVTKVSGNVIIPSGVRKIDDIGAPLPPVFGALRLPSADYQMQVWKWEDL